MHNTHGAAILEKELSLYPITTQKARLVYEFVSHEQFRASQKQWNEHVWLIEKKNSLVAILWQEKPMKVVFCIVPHKNLLFKTGQRWLSNQFTIREEYVGQIFHENALLPALTCLDDVLLVHGAAFKYRGSTFLIGGKGGVGKTSIELRACFHRAASFIADDMAILFKGRLSPNLSYPKIYRYNLVGETQLRKKLFTSFTLLRRLHWHLYPLLLRKEPRIRINPLQHYKVESSECLDYYIIVSREEKEDLFEFSRMTKEDAAEISCAIMRDELKQFQLSEAWFSEYKTLFNKELGQARIIHLRVSKTLPHQAYIKRMEQLIIEFSEDRINS